MNETSKVSFARLAELRRSLRLRWLALGGVVLGSLIVLTALPARRTGSRSATDAYIPLRLMTAAEAAFLLTHVDEAQPDTVVLRADGDDLVLATRRYVLPWKDALAAGANRDVWE